MYTEHKWSSYPQREAGTFPIGCLLCQVNERHLTSFVSESLDVGFVALKRERKLWNSCFG